MSATQLLAESMKRGGDGVGEVRKGNKLDLRNLALVNVALLLQLHGAGRQIVREGGRRERGGEEGRKDRRERGGEGARSETHLEASVERCAGGGDLCTPCHLQRIDLTLERRALRLQPRAAEASTRYS